MACLMSARSVSLIDRIVFAVASPQPAVHRNDLSGDVACPLGREKRDDLGHFARRADAAERHRLDIALARRAPACASACSVSIIPGATALTSTPLAARSRDSPRVNPSSPAFDAA